MGFHFNAALLLLISLTLIAKLSEADLAPVVSKAPIVYPKDPVRIILMNAANEGPMIAVCESRDGEYGNWTIPSGGAWAFQFMQRGTTTAPVFCHFRWGDGGYGNRHFFYVFIYNRDYPRCHTCSWKIFKTKACRLRVNLEIDECYERLLGSS